ncbi:ABC transporter permease [Microbacterium memoriense]|uniref:ABC transporter permease subunit n=1 Tax=Microbacterium memoriense TaxID=2978350 RepID=A0ABT2PF62_9MICO|nr:ABC transporter permease subunit [Microbacterium memoriense]MCT9003244.1 ABC transporter permease subunit [Microbacterium memoriense]
MKGIAPSRATRWVIGLSVGIVFAIPLVATLLYTFRDGDGYSLDNWIRVFDPANTQILTPIWTGLGNSLILAVVTVAIVLLLLLPTMILVELRFPRLASMFEFVVLLPISIPAIVLVVGLAPIYLQIGRALGTGAWTLAFAYGITVLPFAYRSIKASIDAVDLKTLAEAARSLGAGWPAVLAHALIPNLRQGLLAASLISVAVVLGEFTIASLLNRQVLQTALVVSNKIDPYASAMFTLLSLLFVFLLLLLLGRAARSRAGKARA